MNDIIHEHTITIIVGTNVNNEFTKIIEEDDELNSLMETLTVGDPPVERNVFLLCST